MRNNIHFISREKLFYKRRMEKGTMNTAKSRKNISFPWFLLGFIAMSLFASYIANVYVPISAKVMNSIEVSTTFILTVAMIITSVLLSILMSYTPFI